MHRSNKVYKWKTVHTRFNHTCQWILMWEDTSFSLEEAQKQWFKCFIAGFVSYKHAAFHSSRDELMNWSDVDYCDVFISCLESHSDGTHSLLVIYWRASDVMLHFSFKSDEKTNAFTTWMGWGRYIFSKCSIWVNYSFKRSIQKYSDKSPKVFSTRIKCALKTQTFSQTAH